MSRLARSLVDGARTRIKCVSGADDSFEVWFLQLLVPRQIILLYVSVGLPCYY